MIQFGSKYKNCITNKVIVTALRPIETCITKRQKRFRSPKLALGNDQGRLIGGLCIPIITSLLKGRGMNELFHI